MMVRTIAVIPPLLGDAGETPQTVDVPRHARLCLHPVGGEAKLFTKAGGGFFLLPADIPFLLPPSAQQTVWVSAGNGTTVYLLLL